MYLILNSEQIKQADKQTMQLLGITSLQLMEKAATAWTEAFLKYIQNKNQRIHVFCGPGNNGGDGLVISRLLHRWGFKNIYVFIPLRSNKYSEEHQINLKRLQQLEQYINIISTEDPPETTDDFFQAIAIDALFGSGLHSVLKKEWKPWIDLINKHRIIFSVDMPSGFFSDSPMPANPLVVKQSHVITFESIKRMFLFPESEPFIKSWEVVEIGWPWEKLSFENIQEFVITKNGIKNILLPRRKFSHKGTNGRCLIIAGSTSYPGAAVLCAGGSLRSGAGLTYLHSIRDVCLLALQKFPEIIVDYDGENNTFIQSLPNGNYDSLAIGPGMGKFSESILKSAIHSGKPLVIDADALNMLSENPTWLHFLQPNTILTPHPGEFDRLFGKHYNHFERWAKAKEVSKKFGIIVVLKSTYTIVCTPDGNSFFNVYGNPGLAKGGSGDVLTGIIASLLAQGYSAIHAAITGVFIHSLAADLALKDQSTESLTATDIIFNIGRAFQYLHD